MGLLDFFGSHSRGRSAAGAAQGGAQEQPTGPAAAAAAADDFKKVTPEEWRKRLTREQFSVARNKGTERPFSGEYNGEKRKGVYHCVCCDTPLFRSDTKFDSGTGWPSFYDKLGGNVAEHSDRSIPFMPRTEVLCSKCDAHLGHVFNDGPRPTGQRYCINSVSLKLKPETQ